MWHIFFGPPKGQVVKKCFLEKVLFAIFCRFYGLTSDAIFSVICPCRMLFNTIFENYKEKAFKKWFWILSHVFGSGHKMHFKKTIFDDFCQFFSVIFLYYFVRWWGPEGPPMRARRAPQCPPQELEGGARRAPNF